VANSGRLLPGYDFISDAHRGTMTAAGRDADPSDPGDWINSTDTGTSQFKTCKAQISSWHGTRTAGILGALSSKLAQAIAGMTWQAKILPVRVLGKCGGVDSDIIAGHVVGRRPAGGRRTGKHESRPYHQHEPGIHDRVSAELFRCHHAVDCDRRARSSCRLETRAARWTRLPAAAGVAAVSPVSGTPVPTLASAALGPEVACECAPPGNCINTTSGPCVYSIQTTDQLGNH